MNPDSPAFKALQAEWYAKLAASGFQDIEIGDARDGLQRPNGVSREVVSRGVESLGAAYYRRAGQWTWDAVWPSRLDRRCWELHAEGHAHIPIKQRLGTHRGYSERLVRERLKRARAAMLAYVGGSDPDQRSLLEQELSDFDYIHTRGEGYGTGQHGGGFDV